MAILVLAMVKMEAKVVMLVLAILAMEPKVEMIVLEMEAEVVVLV